MTSRPRRFDNDINFDALDAYNKAWASGEAEQIYPLLADSYTLRLGEDGQIVRRVSGFLSTQALLQITKSVFLNEWRNFRKMVEEAGGPKVSQNGNFITTTNAVLREVNRSIFLCFSFACQLGNYAVEGADWSIENFATGVYMCAAKDGKILFEEVSV